MKYEVEIDKFFYDMIFEDWMSEEDYNESLTLVLISMRTTKQKLSDDIEVGVKNGYDVNKQLEISKRIIELNY